MAGNARNSASIDFDVLDDMHTYLARSDRFQDVQWRPEYAPDSLLCLYDGGLYPASVDEALLQVTWFGNDDFNVHYREVWTDSDARQCGWDRHPNDHNTRGHYHPLPDATTPGHDDSFSRNWNNVVSRILHEADERIESFWE